MKDRDEHWKAFGPLYKPMAEMPKYQNNVSKNVTILCTPQTIQIFKISKKAD
ncbi:hypothetical protein [Sphingobacterium daejeonense]|uniref:hypothetical protein n=1 Tax=Sphingobacterium daejeonense TaxID=371142 RepID=UPI0018D8C99B|nr:hypothetical protein [Sphingobacterium daejeonense]